MSFTVLILDDEPWQLSWVEDLAASFGGKCVFTPTLVEATRTFEAAEPDLAIIDVRIGDVDAPPQGATLASADPHWVGLRFLRFVRVDRKSNNPLLFVYTALDREQLRSIVEDSYSARFFTKFETDTFRKVLIQTFRDLAAG